MSWQRPNQPMDICFLITWILLNFNQEDGDQTYRYYFGFTTFHQRMNDWLMSKFSPAQDVDLLQNYSDPNGPWVLDVGLFIDRMSLSESKSVAITLWQEQISFSLAFASVAVLRFAEKTSSVHSVLHCVETSWILPCDIFIFTELSLCLQDVHSCFISKAVPLSGQFVLTAILDCKILFINNVFRMETGDN